MVQGKLGKKFEDLDFFGTFSKPIPNFLGHFHLDAQRLISEYKSAICIENSDEEGYIQGNFLFAILSGTVPIIKSSEFIKKNVLINCLRIVFFLKKFGRRWGEGGGCGA